MCQHHSGTGKLGDFEAQSKRACQGRYPLLETPTEFSACPPLPISAGNTISVCNTGI